MFTEEFSADTIEDAAEVIILDWLKEDTIAARSVSSRDNVLYFDGWDGLGASAVLRAVARRLTTASPAGQQSAPAGLQFDQVIHIDCSMWESRRALQRAVAEQLKLPDEVMELFDKEDEEDDFRGVAQGSRAELQQVIMEINQRLYKQRFLVVFHNGSNEEIDLASCCGFPLSGFSTSKALWTFQGRFRLKPRVKVDAAIKSAGTTDVFVSATSKGVTEFWSNLVQQEATEVAASARGITVQPAQVSGCFLYVMEVCYSIDYDFTTHSANYWVCDGIIQQQGDKYDDTALMWRAAEALQREMPLDVDYHEHLPSLFLSKFVRSKPYWTSPTYGLTRIPDDGAILRNGGYTLQHYADKLCVLKLSRCTLDFQSPPFLCCHSLRFLWLDHCQGTRTTGADDGVGKDEDVRRCFQRLWVLDVRYMHCDQILSAQMMDLMTQLRELNVKGARDYWDIGQLQGRLPNVRKLRVTESGVRCSSSSENNLFSERTKMELLDFSGNTWSTFMSLSGPGAGSSNSSCCLETVTIVDGCHGYGIQQISFRGCAKLRDLLLRGWMSDLRTLDISGTAVKTLDLSAATIGKLNELYLIGCEKLCAILWPPKDKMNQDLARLFIDTMQPSATIAEPREEKAKRGSTSATTGTSAAASLYGTRPASEFGWYISARDARLLSSLEPVYPSSREAYVEVSSIAAGGGKDEGIKSGGSEQPTAPAIYEDIIVNHLQQQQDSEGSSDALGIMPMWSCPDAPRLPEKSSYIHLHDRMKMDLQRGAEETSGIMDVPDYVADYGKILHVHDSLSITRTPAQGQDYSEWEYLDWCRIERCPKLGCVFDSPSSGFTYQLRTFWASQLIQARYIWTSSSTRAFPHLMFLHLDLCPRLVHVLPLSVWVEENDSLHLLETLEITWCGDLREIFPWVEINYLMISIDFPGLKRIHLHELPSLRRICGVGIRMRAPNLETLKIRGCWSLTRLPDVSKAVECDCEKEWWDRLEWEDASHEAQYKPIHSRYYKKTALRGTVLR